MPQTAMHPAHRCSWSPAPRWRTRRVRLRGWFRWLGGVCPPAHLLCGGPKVDAEQFDRIAKVLGSGTSRRRVVRGLLVSSITTATVMSRVTDAQAGKPCEATNQCHMRQGNGNWVCNSGRCRSCRGTVRCISPVTGTGTCCPAGQYCCLCTTPDVTLAPNCASDDGSGSAISSCNTLAGEIGFGTTCDTPLV
jgi:hypothetical protein